MSEHEEKKTMKNGAIISDRRKDKTEPWAFVVFTDSFMSGWGHGCPRRSLYALAVVSPVEAEVVLANGKARPEMKRGRIGWLPRLRPGDHLAVVDRHEANRWYQKGGF
jgi:hypothetical protein